MSDGRINGKVELRPIRLGLVIAPMSTEGLDRAIRFASMCWGGQTFPIFFSDQDDSSIRGTAVRLGVDALVACDDDPRCRLLAEMEGFSWLGYGKLANVDEYGDRPVNLVTVLSGRTGVVSNEAPALVEWDEEDDLAPLFSVLYGRISRASEYERSIYDKLLESVRSIVIPSNGPILSESAPRPGPLELGMWSVEHRSDYCESGIAVSIRGR